LARQLGRPGAARAVGSACAKNPVALFVPCHRVVHHDGEPGGYHWGRERKRALLERERLRTIAV
ncbi:MAG TPA: MGMT family protein, partial [Isosphaeraceae bacterium]